MFPLYKVGIVGATGAVGQEIIKLLESRKFPVSRLRLFASSASQGKSFQFKNDSIKVETLKQGCFDHEDILFFSAGATRSRQYVPEALAQGAFVADNSSAFRMDPNVPLVTINVNDHLIDGREMLISVPNCSAIILLTAIGPLLKLGNIDRIIVSTYQSASGGGAQMMQNLIDETQAYLEDRSLGTEGSSYPPYAFNLFSHNTPIDEDGLNEEEAKVIAESRKILNNPNLKMNVTCVRVPVLRAHSESVTIEFSSHRPDLEVIIEALRNSKAIKIVDDRQKNQFPTPREASGQGDVLVGRIREDISNDRAVSMFIAGDQLLRGAALTAVEIAERHLFQISMNDGFKAKEENLSQTLS